jgi:thiol:disulfide interchange protein DsbD
MKHFFLAAFLIFASGIFNFSKAQEPVKWSAVYKSISASEGEIIITANIEKGWHTYSQRPTKDGPISTSFTFTPSKDYELEGKTTESEAHEEFVKAFGTKIFIFSDKAEFKQKIKLKKKGTTIPVKIEFMCCNDMMCLPPKNVELTVKAQ